MPTMTIGFRMVVLSIPSIGLHLAGGGRILRGGCGGFGRARTRRFGSLF
jgi:hypothetical protein